ncbi:phage tail tape measure protein [Corticibacter populi]|uniref:Phage tail tape measure protein n=1 Tax=Corticibacter populi TaxID=1550736 RepID=A0A3M6QUK7_9BURK|nr:phage tail tape measure protein [Corticibacter populi]RMX06710.1 phage tail tape measure protein [Corticibacter populi]RZS31709.1 lambda family phage tail tape measure protein [Corticibacter populi]
MATEDRRKVQIEAEVDARGAREGFGEVKQAGREMADDVAQSGRRAAEGLGAVGKGARTAADDVVDAGKRGGAGLDPIRKSSDQTAKDMSRAERAMVNSIQRATAALQSGGKAGADYYEMLARQRGISGDILKPYIEQLRQAEIAQKRLQQTTAGTDAVQRTSGGLTDKQLTAAMRGVPAQFTDIAVSLAGGQNPMTVLLQQGGQLKDMFGGVGQAARALGGYVMGLVNPFTLAAAAAGVLGLAYYQGSQEADRYNEAIVMSGNAAGVSAGQLGEMARALDARGFTQGAAAAALAKVAASGNIARDSIQQVAEVALRLERDAGTPVEQTVRQFDELGKSPVEASLKLTEQYRYLTAEVYQQIKALQDQGREDEAAALAQRTYADAMQGRTEQLDQHLGIIQRGWRSITSLAKEAWDAMLDVGRQRTPLENAQEAVDRAQQALDERRARNASIGIRDGKATQELEQQLATAKAFAQTISSVDAAVAKAEADHRATQDAGLAAAQALQKANDSALSKHEQMNKAIKEYRDNIEKLRAADPASALLDPKKIDAAEKAIRDRYKEKEKSGGGTAGAARGLDLSGIQNAMREELAMLAQHQQALELRRRAGLIEEADYYAQKRAMIEQATGIEQGALQQQITRLESEKAKGKEAIQVQKQLGELRASLALKQLDAENKLAAADQEAAAAAARREAALRSLTNTHERYIEQLERTAGRTVSTAWMGSRDRARLEGQWAIEDRYLQQERSLQDQRLTKGSAWTPEDQQQFDLRLEQLRIEQQREIELYQQTYRELDHLQSQWMLGAKKGLQDYVDQAANVAGQMEDAFANAASGMEDALVSFVTTGKLDFRSFAESVIADLVRIQARAALSGLFGSILGMLGTSGSGQVSQAAGGGTYSLASGSSGLGLKLGRANGGPVAAGDMRPVNERGTPELLTYGGKQYLMMGQTGGHVTPLDGRAGRGLASAGGMTLVVNARNHIDSRTDRADVEQSIYRGMTLAVEEAQAQMQYKMSRGMA